MRGLTRPPIPPAFEFLYEPARYKVAYGGRGKGASWSIARRLLDRAHSERRLILCTREVQNSIADSVHRLLVNQIRQLGYSEFFDVQKTTIKSKISGSEFIFRGLNDLTADTIKSMEGVTDVWCAEAQNMGERSWLTLTPTIREGGSEIYVDFNPDAEDAPTYQRFVVNPPESAIVRLVNFDQNPWFPAVLEAERQEALRRIAQAKTEEERLQFQLDYDNVWLGAPRKISMAAIFGGRCVFEDFITPSGAEFMHGADWGYAADPTALVRCYESPDGKRLYIDREAFGYGVELDEIPALFDQIETARAWRIEADSARPETISHVKRRGFDIHAAEKWSGSVEDGIAFLKSYETIHIHATNCPNMVREAKMYQWKLDRVTKQILPIPLDAHNHGWDACIMEGQMVTTKSGEKPIEQIAVGDQVLTRDGYKKVTATKCNGIKPIWELSTQNHTLYATGDHRVWTEKGFTRLDAVRYADGVLTCKRHRTWISQIQSFLTEPFITKKQNIIKAKAAIGCTAESGKHTTGKKSRAGTTSTTSTATLTITTLRTLSAFLQKFTQKCTRFLPKDTKNTKNIATTSGRLQKRGTPAKKAVPNTARLGAGLGRLLSLFPNIAIIAASNSCREFLVTETSSAATPANQRGGAKSVLMTLKEYADSARNLLRLTNTEKHRIVPERVLSIRETKIHARVYDLSVEGKPEFFASGVLVHNCRYAIGKRVKRKRSFFTD